MIDPREEPAEEDLVVEIEAPDPPEEQAPDTAEAAPEPAPETPVEPKPERKAPEYGEKVQKRIDRLVARQHDALRRAEEAEARAAVAEARLAQIEPMTRQAIGEGLEYQIAQAEAKAEAAFNEGNTREAAKALREAAALEVRRDLLARQQQEQRREPEREQVEDQPAPAEAVDWLYRNDWYNRDPVMTRETRRIERQLVETGWDDRDRDFYDELDRQLAERFPGRAQTQRIEQPARPAPAAAPMAPVAPAGRSVSAPTASSSRRDQERLSPEQVDIARQFGISPQAYAKQLNAKRARA